MQITPQMAGTRMGNCKQIPAVDCCPWARFRSVLACKLFIPSLDAHVPQGQSLHGRGFPEFLGPANTTGLSSSTSISPKRLKLRMVSLVSIQGLLSKFVFATAIENGSYAHPLTAVSSTYRSRWGQSARRKSFSEFVPTLREGGKFFHACD